MSTGVSTPGRTVFVEQCWVLIGKQDGEVSWLFKRRCRSSGQIASVEAAWEWALRREERFGDVVGFFHTHPRGISAEPSPRDIRTMGAWCSSFGKPLLCLITNGKFLNGNVFFHAGGLPEPLSISKGEQGWYRVEINKIQ